MAAVLLPAGVGVREGMLLLLLDTVMPVSTAIAIAVLARFMTPWPMDVLCAGIGWLWARAHHLLPDRHTVTVRPPD